MSIVYHGTTIDDSTGQVNYTKNGVTTVLRKVIYRKAGVDTVVYNKTNAASISTSYASASGGSTLNYYSQKADIVTYANITWTGSGTTLGFNITNGGPNMRVVTSGNTDYGRMDSHYQGGSKNFTVGEYGTQNETYNAGRDWVRSHLLNDTPTYTANSYFNYIVTVRCNINYASYNTLTCKVYVNNALVKTQDVSAQMATVTYTYKDSNTLTNRNATVPLKVEMYNGDTLLGTLNGTMASSGTITYGDE